MAWGNAAEAAWLSLFLTNVSLVNVGNAGGILQSTVAGSLFVALHTSTGPVATGDQTSNETVYTNYVREGVARSGASWTITGSAPTTGENAGAITWPTCGVTGATLTYWSVGLVSSSASQMWWNGALTAQLIVSNGITPSMAINALTLTQL